MFAPRFANLNLRPGTCQILGYLLSKGPLLYIYATITLTSVPPLLASTGVQVPASNKVFASCFSNAPVSYASALPFLCSTPSLSVFW